LKLVNTDNKIYNKVTLVFAALCQEMQFLKEAVRKKKKQIKIKIKNIIIINQISNKQ